MIVLKTCVESVKVSFLTGRGSVRETVITNFHVGTDLDDKKNLLGLPTMQQLGIGVLSNIDVICVFPLEPIDI